MLNSNHSQAHIQLHLNWSVKVREDRSCSITLKRSSDDSEKLGFVWMEEKDVYKCNHFNVDVL